MLMALHPLEMDRVLLVDDEIHLTNLWRLVLEVTGRYIVHEENRGERVLQTARRFRPDLIFMDRNLIDADGGEIAARLRNDDEFKAVPVVFVTGSLTQDEAALHGLLGGMPTLAKPFSSQVLVRLADAVLDYHRRQLPAA